jgi:hypothetical protein
MEADVAFIAATNSLFEIDVELDSLLDEIEEQTAQGGEPSRELVARFQEFCSAHGEKVDRTACAGPVIGNMMQLYLAGSWARQKSAHPFSLPGRNHREH